MRFTGSHFNVKLFFLKFDFITVTGYLINGKNRISNELFRTILIDYSNRIVNYVKYVFKKLVFFTNIKTKTKLFNLKKKDNQA